MTIRYVFLGALLTLVCLVAPAATLAEGADKVPHMIRSIYEGNDPDGVLAYEQWLGSQTDAILGYTGNASWEDFDGCIGWAMGLWSAIDRKVLWSVPLIPTGANLKDAAAGEYNDHYTAAAEQLAGFRPQDDVLYIRTAWEFNGDWFPWSAVGKEADFVGAWRQFVNCFRAVSPRFRFDWCPSLGCTQTNLKAAYPGDDYVDVIGGDVYDEVTWARIVVPKDRWNLFVYRDYGLKWHKDFAHAHGKPMSYPEWGVGGNGSGDNDYFVQKMLKWFQDNGVVYESYWDSNAEYPGRLSEGQYPKAAAAYRELFVKGAPAPTK